MSPKSSIKSLTRGLPLLVGLLAAWNVSALAQSTQFPTYTPGENTSASTGPAYTAPLSNPWVVSDGTILTPAGTQVYLGTTTRAKAIALNPLGGTAAVLQMSAPQAVSIICVATAGCDSGNYTQGQVMQTYSYSGNSNGSTKGVAYTSDGLHLLFSQDQDSNYNSWVSIVDISPTTGLITGNYAQVNVPLDATYTSFLPGYPPFPVLNTVSCTQSVTMPVTGVVMTAPLGTTGSLAIPCGIPYTFVDNFEYTSNGQVNTSYPTDIAIAPGNGTAYVVLNFNDELAKIDLSLANPPVEGPVVRVGNVPHSVVVNSANTTAYVSNEAGEVPASNQFQLYSNGTPVLATSPTGSTATGTVSVVDLSNFTVTKTINVGLHPTGMAFWGSDLLVANAYSDTISVINTKTNTVSKTLTLDSALPFKVLKGMTAGLGPNAIAVDNSNNAYVALYNANAIAVIDLSTSKVSGFIPTGYAPSSVVFDATDGVLLVTNDKGLGTDGYGVAAPPTPTYENSYGKEFSVWDFNTHQDLGTASIISLPVPEATLSAMTTQVTYNNHWDLAANIESASGGSPHTAPVAIPAKIGAPSLIKHVFLIIRENRTYDQILGDVVGGNGDASLAVFGDNAQSTAYNPAYNVITPNAHAIVQRFPLLDNYYDPSRQSADGHNWLTQAMAPYSDDVQSPDWLRDYPSNGGDTLAYQPAGHLWDQAVNAGVSFKNYGEYVEENTFNPPGCTPSQITNSCEPSWIYFYNDTQCFENGPNCAAPGTPGETTLYYQNTVGSYTPLPNLMNNTVQAYPQFDLGIPDQYRFDVWVQDFQKDLNNNSVPQLEMMWISSDHTGGPPAAIAMQTDNDLALGRFVSAISNSSIWSSSAIFVTEDDAQTGVDHVDGHRSPGYVISPYVIQSSGDGPYVDSTFYTQVNMTRTIEQILGLKPMNQNDLVASPMSTLFLDSPPADNFLPFNYVANNPNSPPLYYGVSGYTPQMAAPAVAKATSNVKESPKVKALRAGWMAKKAQIFAGNYHKPDVEDSDTVNHLNWYEATGFTRPYPGENTVRPASDFNRAAPAKADLDD
jgi:YVTN family beta-propeller protein